MPWWIPSEPWRGHDAYIVGGGDSLRTFDWGSIRGKHTVGCNSAFLLGAQVVEILLFSDIAWWSAIGRQRLAEYGGVVVGCCPQLEHLPQPSWLLTMRRFESMYHLAPPKCGALGWFGNTGASAANLALAMGAQRVFLLGFDMHLGRETGQANFHDLRHETARAEVYPRFIRDFRRFNKSFQEVYPGREIINVTDDSDLWMFPKVGVADHFKDGAK